MLPAHERPAAEVDQLENFDEDIQRYGIGSICELYDADPPYASRGAISQAWSVGAALDIHRMIRERSKGDSQAPKAAKKSGRTNGPKEKKPAKTKPAAKSAGKTVKAAAKSPAAAKTPKAAAKKAAGKAAKK
ncbi:amylo-alpha-1,6-glucosidase [Alistipes finegoldii]|uniref:amylo-alpha-1,6-glucosidase n=1 Tax=Alistipes finegoldii TaxID=214856 RepID=UPI004025B045